MNAQIFAREYSPDAGEYTIPMEDHKRATDDVQNHGRYLYQLNIDEKFFSSFKSDKLF